MVAGDTELLRSFTAELTAVVGGLRTAAEDASSAITAYNNAPSDLPDSELADVGAAYQVECDLLDELAAVPSAFATLIEAADGDAAMLARLDQLLLDAWIASAGDVADAEALLGALTGTPAELADDLRALLEAGGELSAEEIDDLITAFQEAAGQQWAQPGQTYGGVLITEQNQAAIVWQVLRESGDWDDGLPAGTIDQLLDVTARLAVVEDDVEFTTALFEDLGPEATADLPGLVARAAWSDTYASGGDGFDASAMMGTVSTALGTASPALPDDWWDDLFDEATTTETVEDPNLGWWGDDTAEVVDDAFPALFAAGTFSPAVASRAGQLGIDILAGERADGGRVDVRRGLGSPLYDGFDRMHTHWEDRGATLVEAAARTPEAATDLLGDGRNAHVLTDDHFGRGSEEGGAVEHAPDWDVVSDEVGALIESGTITNLAADPDATRAAAANVINNAVDSPPGTAAEALAPTYAEVGAQYLREFAIDEDTNREAGLSPEGHLTIGSESGAQFLGLGMATEEGRKLLAATHEAAAFDLALSGIEDQYAGIATKWEPRLAKMDAMMLAGELGHDFHDAETARRHAIDYNGRLQAGQGVIFQAVGMAPHSQVPSLVAGPVADNIRTTYLEHPTNQVDVAENMANSTMGDAVMNQRRVIATAHLAAALRAEAAGTLTPGHQQVLDVAAAELSDTTLDNLRRVAAGSEPDQALNVPLEDLDRLRRAFSGMEQTPVFPDAQEVVVEFDDVYLPKFNESLFVVE